MKKLTKIPNININFYDGEFQVGFDCVGVVTCRFALCSIMPPDGDEECCFREYGSCKRLEAQHKALETLHNRIKRELKKYEDADADS